MSNLNQRSKTKKTPKYWDGNAAKRIVNIIESKPISKLKTWMILESSSKGQN